MLRVLLVFLVFGLSPALVNFQDALLLVYCLGDDLFKTLLLHLEAPVHCGGYLLLVWLLGGLISGVLFLA